MVGLDVTLLPHFLEPSPAGRAEVLGLEHEDGQDHGGQHHGHADNDKAGVEGVGDETEIKRRLVPEGQEIKVL